MQPEPRFNITDEPYERGIRTPDLHLLTVALSLTELSPGRQGGIKAPLCRLSLDTSRSSLLLCLHPSAVPAISAESRNRELNSEPPVYKTGALAIELFRQAQVSPTPGVEPEHGADLLMFLLWSTNRC